jgi:hypothetical protein
MSIACKISTFQPNTFAAILFPPCQTASALFTNCQTWALNTRPSSLRGAGFRLNWVPCGSSARQTVPAQLKILGVRLGLFFATAETKLLSFFSLSNHWQWFCQGASAGRQECESGGGWGSGGWEAPWHQSPLPACSSAQPSTGTAGTGVNTLLSGGSPAPHQRGTRSWQVFYPEPFSPGILVKHLSTLQRTNSTNRERERANRAADISQRSKLVNPIRIKTQKAK